MKRWFHREPKTHVSYETTAKVFAAARSGYLPDLRKLIRKRRISVSIHNSYSETPLFDACNAEIAHFLLQNGADVDARNRERETPLFAAVRRWDRVVAKLLIDHGADVNAKNNKDETPLHFAVKQRYTEIAKLLIDLGADANATDDSRETPLLVAVKQRDKEMTKLLIDHGADVNARNKENETPLFFAVKQKDAAMIRLLVELGADVNAANNLSETVLFRASRVDQVKLLIAHGADVNALGMSSRTPLFNAVQFGYAEIAEELLNAGCDANFTDKLGNTPMHQIFSSHQVPALKVLIRHGASVQVSSKYTGTPLHRAASCGSVDIVKLLLDNGANVHGCVGHVLPLVFATHRGHIDTVVELMSRGARYRFSFLDTDEAKRTTISTETFTHVKVLDQAIQNCDVIVPKWKNLWIHFGVSWLSKLTKQCTQMQELQSLCANVVDRMGTIREQIETNRIEGGHECLDVYVLVVFRMYKWMLENEKRTIVQRVEAGRRDFDAFTTFHESMDEVNKRFSRMARRAGVEANWLTRTKALFQRVIVRDGNSFLLRQELLTAAASGCVDTVLFLLGQGACVQGDRCSGEMPLLAAARNGHLDVMETLISKGAAFETNAIEGESPAPVSTNAADRRIASLSLMLQNWEMVVPRTQPLAVHFLSAWLKKLEIKRTAVREAQSICGDVVRHFKDVLVQLESKQLSPDYESLVGGITLVVRFYRWMLEHEEKTFRQRLVSSRQDAEAILAFHASIHEALKVSADREQTADVETRWRTHMDALRGVVGDCSLLPEEPEMTEGEGLDALKAFITSEIRRGRSGRKKVLVWEHLHAAALGLALLHAQNRVHGNLSDSSATYGSDTSSMAMKADRSDQNATAENDGSDEADQRADEEAVRWLAPEILKSASLQSCASDTYAFGMCILEAVTKQVPWGRVSRSVVSVKVAIGRLPSKPECMSDEQWHVVESMCTRVPSERVEMLLAARHLLAFAKQADD